MKRARELFLTCVLVQDPLQLGPHEYVVLGKVKSAFEDEVTITPLRYFKGEAHQRLIAYLSPSDDADCNPSLTPGETYLIYANSMEPPQRPYLAVSLAMPEDDASGVLERLGEGVKPNIQGSNLSPKRDSSRGQRASAGLVIGAAMGIMALVFALIGFIYWLVIRRRNRERF